MIIPGQNPHRIGDTVLIVESTRRRINDEIVELEGFECIVVQVSDISHATANGGGFDTYVRPLGVDLGTYPRDYFVESFRGQPMTSVLVRSNRLETL